MTTKTPQTVRVVAPATLNEGYVFDVAIEDGTTCTVTVPPGGVKEGEVFVAIVSDPIVVATATPLDPEIAMVPIPDEDTPSTNPALSCTVTPAVSTFAAANTTTTKTIINNPDGTHTVTEETIYPDGRITRTVTTVAAGAIPSPPPAPSKTTSPHPISPTENVPTGAWRNDIFSCFETCGNGMFWMSWCCTYIAMGQLLQRMKMNVCGKPDQNYSNTCMIWTILWAACYMAWWIIVGVTDGYGFFLYWILAIFAIVALTQVRFFIRQRWNIPADCCDGSGCLSDCCCVYWCSCCSLIQMLRHTHDEKVHHYSFGSATGLAQDAPEVV